jgi:hypothetical protein
LPYSETHIEDVDTESEDHAYDALRYILTANPAPGLEPREEPKSNFNPFQHYR